MQDFVRLLGCVHCGQPTEILREFQRGEKVNAWICTCQATDRDLESVFVRRKENAWICAQSTTDRDLERVSTW